MKTIYPAGGNVERQEYQEGRQDQSGAVSNEGQREDRQSNDGTRGDKSDKGDKERQ